MTHTICKCTSDRATIDRALNRFEGMTDECPKSEFAIAVATALLVLVTELGTPVDVAGEFLVDLVARVVTAIDSDHAYIAARLADIIMKEALQ
jgi:hypothetical protein